MTQQLPGIAALDREEPGGMSCAIVLGILVHSKGLWPQRLRAGTKVTTSQWQLATLVQNSFRMTLSPPNTFDQL